MHIRSDKRTRRGWLTLYAPVLLWIGLIFLLSSNLGSTGQTSWLTRPILEFLFPGASSDTLNLYQSYVRKLAHLTEYGVLGFLIARMFRSDRASFLSRYWIALSVALVALVAALDEWRQSFLASRTASLYDVVIDLAGGSLAVLIFWLYYRRRLADQFIDL